ncbi:putative HTH-type transcriptional regulator [Candidatus Thermoflexus japonica]|uniref:Putative HTH-type transcriptional regulator n=1 Tax=Candidatus Thermoflexus japonica TaxID=2035417 RepID=A0A2H5Y9I6_9CHLR|nr:putative HTH-type transcriptional regulator [Candidatus Thermoflexus japonica]
MDQEERLWTIGEVVHHLQQRFPDVTPSKLRYWEKAGLIRPRRTQGGHRLYCPMDVERLALILNLRARHRLPLPVVRALLDRLEEDPALNLGAVEALLQVLQESGGEKLVALTAEEAARRAGISMEQLRRMEALGLLPDGKSDEERRYNLEDVALMRVVRDLEAMGITCQNLAFYVRLVRAQVRHDLSLYTPLVGDLDTDAERIGRFRELHRLIQTLIGLLYRKYVRRALMRRWMRRAARSV